jgi:hypothetical protein
MGQAPSSTLALAIARPEDDTIVRRAFDELDATQNHVLDASELKVFIRQWDRLDHNHAHLDLPQEGSLTLDQFQSVLLHDKTLRLAHSWATLHRDVLKMVFAKLDADDLIRVGQVCHHWHVLADADALWKPFVEHTSDDKGGFKTMYCRKELTHFGCYLVGRWFEDLPDAQTANYTCNPDRFIEGFLSGTATVTRRRKHRQFKYEANYSLAPLVSSGETFHILLKWTCAWSASKNPSSVIVKTMKSALRSEEHSLEVSVTDTKFDVFNAFERHFIKPWVSQFRRHRQGELHQKQPPAFLYRYESSNDD